MGGRALEPLPRQDPARFEGCSRTGTPHSSARHRKGDPTLPSTSLMPLVPLLMGFTEPLPCFRVSPRDAWFPPRHGAGGTSPRSEWGPRCASPHGEMGSAGRVGAGCAAGTPQSSARCHCHGNSASHGAEKRQGGRKEAGRRLVPARGEASTGRPSPRHRPDTDTGAGGSAAGGCAQTSAALRDSRQGYLHRENKGPIIYTKQTTMSVNKEAAGEGKAIYSNSANFSSSTIKKTLIIFRNNRRLTNRFSRCK